MGRMMVRLSGSKHGTPARMPGTHGWRAAVRRDGQCAAGGEEVLADDSSAFAYVDLAREVAVVGVLVLGQAPLPTPLPEVDGQRPVVLDEPQQAQRVDPQSIGEPVTPLPPRRRPGPVLLGQVG